MQAAARACNISIHAVGNGSRGLRQLGADSLACVHFVKHLEQRCGVRLPVATAMNHSHSLSAIQQEVSQVQTSFGSSLQADTSIDLRSMGMEFS